MQPIKKVILNIASIICLSCSLFANVVIAQNKSIVFSPAYIEIPNGNAAAALNFSQDTFTLEAWSRASIHFVGDNTIIANDSSNLFNGNLHAGYSLRVSGGGILNFTFSYGIGQRTVASPIGAVDTGIWSHVAVTKKGGDVRLYVNGQMVASQLFTTDFDIKQSSKSLKIGENGSVQGRRFIGRIDEVKIWKVARTQAEIQSDMAAICSNYPGSLLAHYKLDDTGSQQSNSIVCSNNTSLNGVYNAPIPSAQGAVLFNGALTTLYVDSTNTASGCGIPDGSSWSTAFNDLNIAIDVAQMHPQIKKIFVAKGTYYPSNFPYKTSANGRGAQQYVTDNKQKTFHFKSGLEVYGGYPNGGGQANPTLYRTVFDGSKVSSNVADTAVTIVYMYNLQSQTDTSKLVGVTIKNGGGIIAKGSYGGTSIIQNCIVTNCKNTYRGPIIADKTTLLLINDTIVDNSGVNAGAVYSETTHLKIKNSYIARNQTASVIYVYELTSEITDCEIVSNSHGFYQQSGSAVIIGNKIINNGARGLNLQQLAPSVIDRNYIADHSAGNFYGAGIYVFGGGSHQLTNNTILNNAAGYGGGIAIFNSSNLVADNIIANNYAGNAGGGIFAQGGNHKLFRNKIYRNATGAGLTDGGGIYIGEYLNPGDSTIFVSNLVVQNKSASIGGGIFIRGTKFRIANNLFAHNESEFGAAINCFYNRDTLSTIINNTIACNNTTHQNGSVMDLGNQKVTAVNNLFWGNKLLGNDTLQGVDYRNPFSGRHQLINNALQLPLSKYTNGATGGTFDIGNYASTNYFATNPMFADTGNVYGVDQTLGTTDDGLQLLNGSPFSGAGWNIYFPHFLSTLDVKQQPRIYGDSIELGAYEQTCLPSNISSLHQANICNGSSTTLRVNAVAPYQDIKWYADSTSSSLLDTGYYFTTSVLNNPDTFWVVTQGCNNGTRIPVKVTTHQPTIDSIKTSACDSFFWTASGKSYSIDGIYTDTMFSQWGCDSILVLNLTVMLPDTNMANITACDSFYWNITSEFYSKTGTYIDTFINIAGCDSFEILQLVVFDTLANVLNNANILTADTGDTYQWLLCNPYNLIANATSQSYTPAANGDYAVVVTRSGCTDTSACITVSGVNINDVNIAVPYIAPNPTKGITYLVTPEKFPRGNVVVKNMLGQTVFQLQLIAGKKQRIDLSKYPNGLYLVSFSAPNMHYTQKLLKE